MESEEEVRDRLQRLHGEPIRKEMGGQVYIAKAKLLAKILEEDYTYLRGKRIENWTNIRTECVDVSDIFDDLESYQ